MHITSQMVKQAAFDAGAGDVGIANIERFKNAPRLMHPKNIFPDCRSVISIAQPIPRGTYRGINEGTHWANYTFYSYNRLNTLFRPKVTYAAACFIEDHGYEAVPVFPGVAETSCTRPPVAPDRPPADINLNVRIAALACGLGEIGWSKVFISRKYGPRVRLGTILTDAELEPDPLIKPGTLCNKCMRCVKFCPGNAIPRRGERPPIKITIDDQEYEWGDVHMGRCTLTHHGLNWRASPFLVKDEPGFDLDVTRSNMSEEAAYKMAYPIAQAKWRKTDEFPPGGTVAYYNQIITQTGYFAVCGAKGCIQACTENMEKRKCIDPDQCKFQTPLFARKPWELTPPDREETGGVAEGKGHADYYRPDAAPGTWQ